MRPELGEYVTASTSPLEVLKIYPPGPDESKEKR
jgi:hypothetical protein